MESHLKSGTETNTGIAPQQASPAHTDGAAALRHWDPPALKRVWEAPAVTSIPLDAAETGILFGPEILILLS